LVTEADHKPVLIPGDLTDPGHYLAVICRAVSGKAVTSEEARYIPGTRIPVTGGKPVL
jgi:hypothetical protein